MMNPLSELISNALKAQGLTKFQLIKAIGYKNESKGFRRLEEFLATGNGNSLFTENLPKVLGIPQSEFLKAIKDHLAALNKKAEQEARKRFHPYIEVLTDRKMPIFIYAFCRSGLVYDVPLRVIQLPPDEELEGIKESIRRHYQRSDGNFLGDEIIGYRYHREFEERLEYDVDGYVTKVEKGVKPHLEYTVMVGGRRLPVVFDLREEF